MNIWFDIRYALRLLLKSPGFSVLTITVMACGLGLALYMFSIINTIMYKTLPYPNGSGMVLLTPTVNGETFNDYGVNFLDYELIRQRARTLEDMSYFYAEYIDLKTEDTSVRYIAVRNTPSMFSYTGVHPLLGRAFDDQDMAENALPVAIISYDLWQKYFQGRGDIVGLTVKINSVNTQIVGVMPKGFAFPFYHDLWLPAAIPAASTLKREKAPEVFVFAHLAKKRKPVDADRELDGIMRGVVGEAPNDKKEISVKVLSFQESFTGEETAQSFLVMLSAVGFVLLLACCNVGNLLLARSNRRTREIAIRVALGSPTSRLLLQMVWESLIICTVAGIIGVLLASWGLDITNYIFPKFVPNKIPVWWHLSLDGEVIIDAIVLVIITALVTSALPAWKVANGQFAYALRDGANSDQGRRTGKFSRTLVVVEVALSCSILCISVLLLFLVIRATKADYGVPIDNYLVSQISLSKDNYPDSKSRGDFYIKTMEILKKIPGVSGGALISNAPGQFTFPHQVTTEDLLSNTKEPQPYSLVNDIKLMPGNLSEIGAAVLYGREFSFNDDSNSLPVAVVSNSFAQRYWPGEKSVIGKKIRFIDGNDSRWFTIIGVAPHIIHGRPFSEFKSRPTVYRSLLQLQQDNPPLTLMLKTTQQQQVAPMMQQVIRQVNPSVGMSQPQMLSDMLIRNTAGVEFVTNLFLLFGLAAMVLAASGIYGVTQNAINQRTQEIGIRQALGASPTNLMRMLMFSGLKQLFVGLALGLPLAIFAAPKINRVYGDGSSGFILLFLSVAFFILITVSLATWIPSRRAIMMKPGEAIRYE
ncbi:ABC transporter permease [Musicola paradisiaca]|uniref:Permease n=1 Tax=Musicola paradisiaca (strain Ech703) TaxID=579405 RepID=C6C6J6_MUSP7|nr:ABC transporter permease [Musicola paradisiaca]ACS83915.1 protein of unknown function DUF214 [Musicola paradisiaca Ech703]